MSKVESDREAWQAFAAEVSRLLEEKAMTRAGLARALGLAPEEVRNWLYLRSRPPLTLLPAIAQILGVGQEHLLVAMGVLTAPRPATDANVVHLATLLTEAEQVAVRRANDVASDLAQTGVARLVNAALDTERWGVAVWPAVEGPPECRIRVADRLLFLSVTGDTEPVAESFSADLRDALRDSGAIKVRNVANAPWRASDDGHDLLRYSIPRFTGARAPRRSVALPRLASLGVVSLVVDAWVSDVAAHVSEALGYGLTSSRSLATAAYGVSPDAAERSRHRIEMARHLLAHPPERYVWYHFSNRAVEDDPITRQQSVVGPISFLVRLRETDDLLELSVRNQVGSPPVELKQLVEARAAQDRAFDLETEASRVLTVEVGLPPEGSPTTPTTELREPNFVRSLQIAAHIIDHLQTMKLVPAWAALDPCGLTRWAAAHPR